VTHTTAEAERSPPTSTPSHTASPSYEIAERALDRLVPTVLLHVGDFDPSGESIFTAMSQDAAAFVRADRIIETLAIEPVRVALTADQVAAFNLPTARSAKWQGGTCQLEALAPDELAEIVRAEIENRIDFEIFEFVLAQERDDRSGRAARASRPVAVEKAGARS